VPTKTHIKFGSRISTKGDKCAYFEGSAYLLDLRCFLAGRGDADVVAAATLVAIVVVVRERFADGRGDTDDDASFSLVAPLVY
jgi:hypothetical protein